MSKKRKTAEIVGEVCLYGAPHCGYGYIATTRGGSMFGTGEPNARYSQTDAIWSGLIDLQNAEYVGDVNVYASGGELMATTSNAGTFQYPGQMKWGPAPKLTISADELIAAADAQAWRK